MYCGKCGKNINSNFCPYCGAKNEYQNNINNNIVVNNNISTNNNLGKKKFDTVKLLIALILFFVLLFVSMVGYSIYKNNRSRTIMIYMVGSNLESRSGLATLDLSYLDYNKINSNKVKVVLIAGGTKSWKNNYIDVGETSIYELKENGFVKVDQMSIDNMGSQDNLTYFLNYVHNNYKTNKYDFIYWNHGGAVDGSEYDDFTNDHLDLIEMANSFEKSNFKGSNKLEVIAFRTCLNSTIEVANIYKKYARYLVASEEVTMGSKYDSALRFINIIRPSDEGIDFGKKQITNYKETVTKYCNLVERVEKDENYCVNATYSIVDLSKVDNINEDLDSFSEDLNKNIATQSNNMIKKRANMNQYVEEEPAYDMIDLYDLADTFGDYSKNGNNLKKSVEKAVVYNWTNNNYSHGLSIYFPFNRKIFLNKYSDFEPSKNYGLFINSFYNYKEGGGSSSFNNVSNNDINVSKVTNDSADIEVELSEEQIKNISKAGYYIIVDTKDGYYQIVFNGKDYRIDGNKLKANVKGKMLRISDSEYEDLSIWVPAIEKETTDKYTDVQVIVSPNNPGFADDVKVAYFDVRIDDKNREGTIKGFYGIEEDSSKDKTNFSYSAPVGLKLDDFFYIETVSSHYKVIDDNGVYNPNWINTSNGIIQGMYFRTNRFKFIKEDFSSNYDYYAVFIIKDMANNEYYTKPVKIK